MYSSFCLEIVLTFHTPFASLNLYVIANPRWQYILMVLLVYYEQKKMLRDIIRPLLTLFVPFQKNCNIYTSCTLVNNLPKRNC
jgi:hypothetical protein